MNDQQLPRILIIDDLYGRTHPDRANADRESLCAHLLIRDITNDELGKEKSLRLKVDPVAEAVFLRGLRPSCSAIGDVVEHDLEGTLKAVRSGWDARPPGSLPWAMVLLDLCFYTGNVTESSSNRALGMPEGRANEDSPEGYFGLRILEALQKEMPELPVIILSAQPKDEVSREFTSRGGLAFLSRRDQKGSELLREYIRRYGLIPDDQEEIVGHSNSLLFALRTARNAASTKLNVLMRGETGTGKELIARFLHRCAKKESEAKRPFIVINSAAIASSLWNSELFGIESKAATGVDRKRGEIRSAHGGDLFFDEIGDMREDTQAGILRVLEDRKVKPVGTGQYVDVDVRFISATEKDIEAKAAIGSFRGALLQRLRQGGTVFLPPLRERMDDIPILVKKFVEEAQNANPAAMNRTIEPETLDKIRSFDWPGNIRQLHDCIVEAVNNYLDVEHLFPIHIKFPESRSRTFPSPVDPRSPGETASPQSPIPPRTINELIAEIDNFDFSQHLTDDLVGKLPPLERAYARLSARYLEAALKANTKNRSAERPEGDFSIKQAVETMTGSKVEGYVPRRMIEQVLKNESNRSILEKEDSILAAVGKTLSERKNKGKKAKE